MLDNYDEEPFRGIPYLSGNGDDLYIRFYNNTTVMTNGDVKTVSTMVDITDADNPILRPILVACSTMATASVLVAVVDDPKGTVAADTWGTAIIRGCVKAKVDGDTNNVAYGDQLQVVNATPTAFVVGQSGSTATAGVGVIMQGNSAAVALETNTGAAALKWVYLIGDRIVVAATQ
jgi:hypothetical protein